VQRSAGKIEEPLRADRWEMQEPAGKIEEPLRAEGWEVQGSKKKGNPSTVHRQAIKFSVIRQNPPK
jgi:hypothetical protein